MTNNNQTQKPVNAAANNPNQKPANPANPADSKEKAEADQMANKDSAKTAQR